MQKIPVYLGQIFSSERLEAAIVQAAAKMNLKVTSRNIETKEVYRFGPTRKERVYDRTIITIGESSKGKVPAGLESLNWFVNIEFKAPPSLGSRTDSFCLKRRDASSSNYEKLVLKYLDIISKKLYT